MSFWKGFEKRAANLVGASLKKLVENRVKHMRTMAPEAAKQYSKRIDSLIGRYSTRRANKIMKIKDPDKLREWFGRGAWE